MEEYSYKGLWRKIRTLAEELHKTKHELIMANHFKKQLVEENDRLITEILKIKNSK